MLFHGIFSFDETKGGRFILNRPPPVWVADFKPSPPQFRSFADFAATRVPPEQSTCIKNPVPDVTGNLQPLPGTHIQTYSVLYYLDRLSRLRSSLHNQILEKLDRTEKQLEVIKAENRQLMDMVKQLLHRAPKRRKVLVKFLINRTLVTNS